MRHIVLGSNGRIAKELILRLSNLGISPDKISSKSPESVDRISNLSEKEKLVVYDFMSASRPGYEGCPIFENSTREKILAYGKGRIHKYVYLSSAGEIYKAKGKVKSLDDIVYGKSMSNYARRKLEVERTIVKRIKNVSKIVRVTNVYGGNYKSKDLGVVDNWLDDMKSGRRPKVTTDIDTYRNYIHIDVVIDEILSEQGIGSTLVLDTADYFFLSEIYTLIFGQNISLTKIENDFDLSQISNRKRSSMIDYIKNQLK